MLAWQNSAMNLSPSQKPIGELVVDDVGGAFTVGLAYIGDKLGLFSALAILGPASSDGLARQTGLDERYVREWLKAMVSSRYIEHDAEVGAYFMTPEQTAALVDEAARTFIGGVFQFALPSLLLAPRLIDVFKNGGGIPFGDLPTEIHDAIERMHRPWFEHLLVQQWLPGAPGIVEELDRGISVLDVGCGLGRSSIALARAFPKSAILGIDVHEPSIEKAQSLARKADLANVRFSAQPIDGSVDGLFDLVVAIDCVHDMVDPVQSLRAMAGVLSANGAVFWSEPSGSREPLENRNPQGKLRANLSPFHCLTVSLAEGGAGLGTIIGEAGARELAGQAGFRSFEKLPIENPMQQFFLLRAGS
jgi:2-polyprenyl-3-methyl-5-hydroxy-6-metoxy-1,4-benzoquinol methylase